MLSTSLNLLERTLVDGLIAELKPGQVFPTALEFLIRALTPDVGNRCQELTATSDAPVTALQRSEVQAATISFAPRS